MPNVVDSSATSNRAEQLKGWIKIRSMSTLKGIDRNLLQSELQDMGFSADEINRAFNDLVGQNKITFK